MRILGHIFSQVSGPWAADLKQQWPAYRAA